MARKRATPIFTEKEFYLDEFRGRTLLVAVHHDGPPDQLRVLGEVARDLLQNDTRVLVLLSGAAAGERAALRALERVLAALPAAQVPLPQVRLLAAGSAAPLAVIPPEEVAAPVVTEARLLQIWAILRTTPFFLGLARASGAHELAGFAQRLGARFRVHKLVIVDPAGGVRAASGEQPLSFMDEAMAEQLLHAGEAEWVGIGTRRPVLEAIRAGLLDGIASINLCSLDGLAHELFTYEGAGTLFTREDYCRVERLALDDFHEVEQLLGRGQREGYLKARSDAEIAHLLFSGWGATIGQHHLAGICSLETERYVRARAGEIVGLYTITRFKGEGVGVKLVAAMKAEARARDLAYLFACTTQERVGTFFERQGLRRIAQDEVPVEKWEGYDPARRAEVAVYRWDVPPAT